MRIIVRVLFFLTALCLSYGTKSHAQAPVITAKPGPIILKLDATGNYTVQLSDVATVTGDYTQVTLSPSVFTCSDVGSQTVIVNAVNATNADPVARLNYPYGVVCDATGNIYVADAGNNQIKKITPAGVVTVFAGSGQLGSTDGAGTIASFSRPWGLCKDKTGNIFVADAGNNKIREISPGGAVSTVAGSGNRGADNGVGTSATFNNPAGVAVDAAGNIYVVDSDNNLIRKIQPGGSVSTFAGNGQFSSVDGNGTDAGFYNPHGITIDGSGYLYITDGNNRIRRISPTADVITFAGFNSGSNDGTGVAASFYFAIGITIDALGNLYIADTGNNLIRKVTPGGVVTTIAGDGSNGSDDGKGKNTSINAPVGIALDPAGNLYVTQAPGNRIRKIDPQYNVTTPVLTGVNGEGARSSSLAVSVIVQSQPVITSTYNNMKVIAYGDCSPILPDYTKTATTSDNCPESKITLEQSPATGTPLTVGAPVNVTLTATDASGAQGSVQFNVDVVSPTAPLISFAADPSIFYGSNTQLEPMINGDVVSYAWSPSAGLSNTSIKNPVAAPPATTTYTLTVLTEGGCEVSVDVTVNVIGQIVIPNVFTPNGDGINDLWNIAHINEYPRCTVDVFNRSGQQVFHSTGYSKPWEGTYDGNILPTGPYYYVIDLKDGRQKISGQVTIVR